MSTSIEINVEMILLSSCALAWKSMWLEQSDSRRVINIMKIH